MKLIKVKTPRWILKLALTQKHKHVLKLNKELQPEYKKILEKLYELIGEKEDEEQFSTIAILCLAMISGFEEHEDRQRTIVLLAEMEKAL